MKRMILALFILLSGCSVSDDKFDALLDTVSEALEEDKGAPPSAPDVSTPAPPISTPATEEKPEKKPVAVDAPSGRDCRGAPYNCCFAASPDRNRRLDWDGRSGGFLWKPKSDHRDGGVFLLAGWYGRADSVQLCCEKGCETLIDNDGGNADPEGCRHHFLAPTPKQIERKIGGNCQFVPDGRREGLKIRYLSRRKE